MLEIKSFHDGMVSYRPLASLLTSTRSIRTDDPNDPDATHIDENPEIVQETGVQHLQSSRFGTATSESVLNIHRGFVPYQDILARIHANEIPMGDIMTLDGKVGIPPYLYYQINGTEYRTCLSGVQTKEWVDVSVEIVAFEMEAADAISCAFDDFVNASRASIFSRVSGCFSPPPDPDPYPGCVPDFADIELFNAAEDYRPFNQIAIDLGATVVSKAVRIYLP